MADNEEAWTGLRFQIEEVRDAGEQVVVIGQLAARAYTTGADVRARLAMLFEFRDDLLAGARTYTDVEEALQAAGLAG
jgi:ketosteroid isomerase-like protein